MLVEETEGGEYVVDYMVQSAQFSSQQWRQMEHADVCLVWEGCVHQLMIHMAVVIWTDQADAQGRGEKQAG